MRAPPPTRALRLVPLGGLGEVGMNCMVLEQGDDALVIDCGVRFPASDLGIDVLRPDFTWLEERADRVRGVFLTHGHEDHIGALPYLLEAVRVPVWGPPHALGLAKRRLHEHGLDGDVDLRVAVPGETVPLGTFGVTPIRVAHSIVEASALHVDTVAGTVVHTGDFNFDPDPPDGEPTDERRLSALGDAGVGLLLSDSTNVDVDAPGGSERAVGEALDRIVREATERVFVALFASNIQRLILLGEIARRAGRRICALGRSLETQIEVATQIGRLAWPSDLRVAPSDARAIPRGKLLVLAGGTQGEPAASMTRLANGTHADLPIDPGDVVVFSSRIIPGNERAAFEVIANVQRRGAILHTRVTNPAIHTSGHATRSEQTRMLDLVRPRSFLPIHGTLHHLTRHGALARDHGVPDVQVVENGASLLFDGTRLTPEGSVPVGVVSVGMGGVPLAPRVLSERAELARHGLATVAVTLDRRGRLAARPSITLRGIGGIDDADAELRRLALEVERAVEKGRRQSGAPGAVRDAVRRVIRHHLGEVGGSRPVVEVHVLEEDP